MQSEAAPSLYSLMEIHYWLIVCKAWAILAITNLSEWDCIAHFADVNITDTALDI